MLIQNEIKLYGQKSNINGLWCISSLFSIHILFAFFSFSEIWDFREMPQKYASLQTNDVTNLVLEWQTYNETKLRWHTTRPVKYVFQGRRNRNARQDSSLTIIWQATAKWIWDRSIFFSIFTSQYDSLILLVMSFLRVTNLKFF